MKDVCGVTRQEERRREEWGSEKKRVAVIGRRAMYRNGYYSHSGAGYRDGEGGKYTAKEKPKEKKRRKKTKKKKKTHKQH